MLLDSLKKSIYIELKLNYYVYGNQTCACS